MFYHLKSRGNNYIEKVNTDHRYDKDSENQLIYKPVTKNGSVVISTHGMWKDPKLFAFLTKYELDKLAVGSYQPDYCIDDKCILYPPPFFDAEKDISQSLNLIKIKFTFVINI